MNAKVLLEYFDRISEAPKAVPQLRRFIMDLAVRGKLVEQVASEGTGAELLKQIERAKLCLENTTRRRKVATRPIQLGEVHCSIPKGWYWARIREVTSDRGQTVPKQHFTYIDVSSIDKEYGRIGEARILSPEEAPSRARKVVQVGDVLYSCVRPYLLNIAVVETAFAPEPIASTAFAVLNGFGLVLPRYLWIVLRSPLMVQQVESKMRGLAYPAINDSDFGQLPMPLPPLAEQRRIVIKIDELMALCDRLEDAERQRESSRALFTLATHRRLSYERAELSTQAASFIRTLPQLTTHSAQILAMRNTIRSLGVRGLLSTQEPSDASVSEAIRQIHAERQQLIDQGRIRKERAFSAVSAKKWPFALPESWQWLRIGEVALFTEYGTSHKSHAGTDGIPVLKMGDIQEGAVVLNHRSRVPEAIDDLPALFLAKYDLLYNRTNSADLVGKTGIYLGERNSFTFASYLIRIRCSLTATDPHFVNLAMNSPFFRETQIVPHLKQQCGQANVNGTVLKQMIIPFPPVAEQKRIVARVQELEALCDALQHCLNDRSTKSAALLQSVLRNALQPPTKLSLTSSWDYAGENAISA
jgi:type I restriction enzyme S subunit